MMNWKHIALLSVPLCVFAFLAWTFFEESRRVFSQTDAIQEIERQQDFESFTNKVLSQKGQFPQDKLIENLCLSRSAALADRRALRLEGELMRSTAWCFVCGIIVQSVLMLCVKHWIAKQSRRMASVASGVSQ